VAREVKLLPPLNHLHPKADSAKRGCGVCAQGCEKVKQQAMIAACLATAAAAAAAAALGWPAAAKPSTHAGLDLHAPLHAPPRRAAPRQRTFCAKISAALVLKPVVRTPTRRGCDCAERLYQPAKPVRGISSVRPARASCDMAAGAAAAAAEACCCWAALRRRARCHLAAAGPVVAGTG
jgi:hypothetical protein